MSTSMSKPEADMSWLFQTGWAWKGGDVFHHPGTDTGAWVQWDRHKAKWAATRTDADGVHRFDTVAAAATYVLLGD